MTENFQPELIRRHKAASTTVIGLMVGTVLLSIIAYLGKRYFGMQQNPMLDVVVRVTILIFGLGAVVLRRTRFATMRLQDIGGLRGASGLLQTLEKTTLHVALLGSIIAVIGFVATAMTGNDFYSYGAGLVSLAVLFYSYPTRTSWERTVRKFAPDSDQNNKGSTFGQTA